MKGIRKLVLSIISLSFTLASLITSTFAFVVMSSNVEINAEFNIEGYEGLGISLDGNEFTQDITSESLKEKIAGSVENYDKLSFRGVTPMHDNNGKISFTSLSSMDGEVPFMYLYNNHYISADKNEDYLQFDLYFTALNSKEKSKNYDLFLVSDKPDKAGTKITGVASEVELLTSLTTPASIDSRTGVRTSGPYKDTAYVPGEYKAKDKITVDPSNAVRIGVTTGEYSNSSAANTMKMSVFETPNEKDLGSSAIEGRTDERHNKDLNAMYTYYNSWNVLNPLTSAAEDGEAFNTSNDFEKDAAGNDNPLGVLKYDNATSSYNIIKVTMYVWLEGWDADYFLGVPISAREVNINLVFEMRERD